MPRGRARRHGLDARPHTRRHRKRGGRKRARTVLVARGVDRLGRRTTRTVQALVRKVGL